MKNCACAKYQSDDTQSTWVKINYDGDILIVGGDFSTNNNNWGFRLLSLRDTQLCWTTKDVLIVS